MEKLDPLFKAQLIVRGEYINFGKSTFSEESSVYRFSNEDISSYFHHLKNKENVLTVIGSGSQVLNGILAGSRNFDCFDISVFPEYYLYLQLASVMALSKEDYLKFYFSEDREELFGDDFYDRISERLSGKYKEFWDTLYMFDDGIDICNSLLFRSDVCLKKFALDSNPYLQDSNYEKLRHILQTESIRINPVVADITRKRFDGEYDLVNLSNILSYYFRADTLSEYVSFLESNFTLTSGGEIINYFFDMKDDDEKRVKRILGSKGYVEDVGSGKLLVYKRDDMV